MKYVWALGLIVTAASTVGCNTNPPQVAQVPPPPPVIEAQPEIIVPVQVEEPAASANASLQVQPTQQVQFNEPAPAVQIAAPASAPAAAVGPTRYIIKKGDTLWSIASKHYGNGQKWVQIQNANPGLKEKRMIPGKEITLP